MTDTTRTDQTRTTIAASEPGADGSGSLVQPTDAGTTAEKPASLWTDAWYDLRRSPLFWISSVLILVLLVMAVAPGLFTSVDPTYASLAQARQRPSDQHVFGTTALGYDVYSRTIYGARASVLVGLCSSILTAVIGIVVGLISGFTGGWLDAVLSRVGEIFFAIPLLLGGILFLYVFPNGLDTPFWLQVGKVVLVIAIFGWPSVARLMRSSVLQVKPNDYVTAARALGGSPGRLILQHVLPNAIAPVIVVSTINLGVFISVEATLSFLNIGLRPPAVSWGIDISNASSIGLVRAAPNMLLFPSLFLSVTVLAFIMLGDAVRDAIDPKLR
ncbi:oligopeptide transport system permease protein [Microlunatus sagamiharensis]|uniref:Oligopeptide transport system permease protein n=1 Tax=Microlunatus sagamiharensis TaxID=546874 RepID=A0A1H2MTR0_9ACTN|nr:ABC transporter permease [Microlunatus sagamiharensis]SDU96590.1 oligopeptide transport system permease protein [Microlunatus sagamiharensis]